MVYCFDLDGTICSLTENNNYPNAVPMVDMVEAVNKLAQNHRIIIFTARGASSGIDWRELTTDFYFTGNINLFKNEYLIVELNEVNNIQDLNKLNNRVIFLYNINDFDLNSLSRDLKELI